MTAQRERDRSRKVSLYFAKRWSICNPLLFQTIYKNIYKFPSGSWLKIKDKDLEIHPYWKLDDKVYDTPTQKKLAILNKEKEAKELFPVALA